MELLYKCWCAWLCHTGHLGSVKFSSFCFLSVPQVWQISTDWFSKSLILSSVCSNLLLNLFNEFFTFFIIFFSYRISIWLLFIISLSLMMFFIFWDTILLVSFSSLLIVFFSYLSLFKTINLKFFPHKSKVYSSSAMVSINFFLAPLWIGHSVSLYAS